MVMMGVMATPVIVIMVLTFDLSGFDFLNSFIFLVGRHFSFTFQLGTISILRFLSYRVPLLGKSLRVKMGLFYNEIKQPKLCRLFIFLG